MADKDYIGKDKVKHMFACLIIAIYSTEAAITAAITKEYADSNAKGNHWCWWDLVADAVGIAIGTAIRVLIIKRWNWL